MDVFNKNTLLVNALSYSKQISGTFSLIAKMLVFRTCFAITCGSTCKVVEKFQSICKRMMI